MGFFKDYLSKDSKFLIRNSSWVMFSNFSRVGLIFVKSIIITQSLGVKVYGDYLTILALILSIQAFFNLNFGTVLIKFGSEYKAEGKDRHLHALLKLGYQTALSSSLLSVVVITGFVFLTRYFFDQHSDQEWNVVVLALAFGSNFIDYIPESFLRLHFKFKLTAFLSILSTVIDLGITSVSAWIFRDEFSYFLYGIAGAKMASSLCYNVLASYFIRRLSKERFFAPLSLIRTDFKTMFRFISSNYGSRLLKNLIEQGDILVLGYFSNQSEVGIYGVGKRLGYAILSFIDPLVNSIFPQFAQMIAEKNYKNLLQLIRQFSWILVLPGLLLLVITYFTKDFLITFIYGSNFLPAADVFWVVLFAAIIASVTFWNITLLISLNEVNYRFKMNLFILFVSLPTAYLVIPSYGALGAAIILVGIKLLESAIGSYRGIRIVQKQLRLHG
ncbi:MAG: hypothetical protein EP338_02230 [Bacteroidetes bacterium]|nr:MAG: hypothetical protein EP338_02230 [Bacteroidota bacterium]